jgi:hypothetical protein
VNQSENKGQPRSSLRDVGLALVAIYLPFLSLFFLVEDKVGLIEYSYLFPLFPGVAIMQLAQAVSFLHWVGGIGGAFFSTLLFVGGAIFAIITSGRVRWLVWTLLAVITTASVGLVRVMLVLMKA